MKNLILLLLISSVQFATDPVPTVEWASQEEGYINAWLFLGPQPTGL